MKVLCPNCKTITDCDFVTEIYYCNECQEDFSAYEKPAEKEMMKLMEIQNNRIETLKYSYEGLLGNRRWIPVKERLPKKPGDYLTTAKYDDCDEGGNIFRERWNGRDWVCSAEVIAWMPLPEPYKEEE